MKTSKSLLHGFGILIAASTLSLAPVQVASAGAIFTQGFPLPAGMDVVRFPVTDTDTGPAHAVTGVVGAGPVAKRPVIEFTSDVDMLLTSDSSVSPSFIGISSTDDDGIQRFAAQLENGVFTSFFFNTFVRQVAGNPAGRFATITVYEADGGQSIFTPTLRNASTNNRFLIQATNGDLFTRVEFSTLESIVSIRQLRIDGVQPSPVPEPAALWIVAVGLLGMTLVRRSKTN